MKIVPMVRHVVAICVAVAPAAGCAGPGTPPQLQQANDWLDAAVCRSDHGVRVVPCSVYLTPDDPTAKVVAHGPKGGTFTFNDTKCVAESVARIRGKGTHYTALAGTQPGICTAIFVDKESSAKIIGRARLKIGFYRREHCPPTCQTFAIVAR